MASRAVGRRVASNRTPTLAGQKLKQGRTRTREAHSESRERVLNAARRLFAEFGFEATSIRQIANELNIVSASLYHHFQTKEQMLHEIVRDPLRGLAERAIHIAGQPVDAEHRLVALIVLRIQASVQEWEVHAIVANEAQFFRQHEDFSYVQHAKVQGNQALESVLQDGIKAGLFRKGIDIYFTIRTISSVLISAAKWVRADEVYSVKKPTAHSTDRIIDLNVDFILRAIRSKDRIADPIPRVFGILETQPD